MHSDVRYIIGETEYTSVSETVLVIVFVCVCYSLWSDSFHVVHLRQPCLRDLAVVLTVSSQPYF